MQIISLVAENIKRLTAVSIKPDGKVVTISGRNDQGKSSVLDSIWYGLGGVANIDPQPIHDGAQEGSVFLDLGDIRVTRKFRRKEGVPAFTTTLTVESADGKKFASPQTMLDELVGRFSLDPMAFIRMKPKEQYDQLKVLVPGLDMDDIEAKDKADYEARTHENRLEKELRAAANAIQVTLNPVKVVDEAPLLDKLAKAGEHNDLINARTQRRRDAETKAAAFESQIEAENGMIKEYEAKIAASKNLIEVITKEALELRQKLKDAPPLDEPIDTLEVSKALSAARETNAIAQKQKERKELLDKADRRLEFSKSLTQAMEARETHKNAMIAGAKFPVPGLGLGKEEVLIDGFPFAQAATSKKIRTAVALAMAFKPAIKVIRITDGSLLDSDAMKIVAEMAEANDTQVWVESVTDGTGVGIVIEDGMVKEIAPPPAKAKAKA